MRRKRQLLKLGGLALLEIEKIMERGVGVGGGNQKRFHLARHLRRQALPDSRQFALCPPDLPERDGLEYAWHAIASGSGAWRGRQRFAEVGTGSAIRATVRDRCDV